MEVVLEWRRVSFPLKSASVPRISWSFFAVDQRLNHVDQCDREAQAQQVRTNGRQLMPCLEFREVGRITTRHALCSEDELREERDVKACEHEETADLAPELVQHAASHLRPPVVKSTYESRHCSAHHHVVEVSNNEIRVVQVDVDGQSAEEQACQTANRKEEQECQGVPHSRVESDRAAVHGGNPAEDLDGRWNSNCKREE